MREPIITKICIGDYVLDTYRDAEFYYDPIREFCPHLREIAYRVSHSVTFLGSRYPEAVAPILTLNTPKDVVSRKNVPFWGSRTRNFTF